MSNTSHLLLPLVFSHQSQKEVTVNEALTAIDALLNTGVVSMGVNTPPASPANGDVYVIGGSPTGQWEGKDNQISYFQDSWKYIIPREGVTLWANDEDKYYSYDGSAWGEAFSLTGAELQNISLLGVNATADSTNKLTVKSNAVLFATDSGNVQLKVNKPGSSDTASYLFQTGYSGRAEFGLIGDDDFQLKVSPDGSSFVQAMVVDKSSGDVDFKQDVHITGTLSDVDMADNILQRVELKDYAETRVSASSGSSYTIDLENGNVYEVTLTANCTFTFSNPPASGKGGSFTLLLKQDATGERTVTWPASVKWAGGTAPTLTTVASSIDILTFITTDAGTAWYGFLSGADLK